LAHDPFRILREHVVFRDGSERALHALERRARVRRVADGAHLCRKGDPARELYLVVAGVLRVGATSQDGKDLVLNIVGAGELIGEVALFDEGVRSADVVALTDVALLSIDRRDLETFLIECPDCALRMIGELAKRFRRLSALVESIRLTNLSGRLAQILLRMAGPADATALPAVVAVSQTRLAAMCLASREEVNRQLRTWARAGVVRSARGAVTILDRAALLAAGLPSDADGDRIARV
jgi:CRP/FNR family cyclic AMP-dependent transcriptional regulator